MLHRLETATCNPVTAHGSAVGLNNQTATLRRYVINPMTNVLQSLGKATGYTRGAS
jgi:hypothetical protein